MSVKLPVDVGTAVPPSVVVASLLVATVIDMVPVEPRLSAAFHVVLPEPTNVTVRLLVVSAASEPPVAPTVKVPLEIRLLIVKLPVAALFESVPDSEILYAPPKVPALFVLKLTAPVMFKPAAFVAKMPELI